MTTPYIAVCVSSALICSIKMLKLVVALLLVAATAALRYDGYHILSVGRVQTRAELAVMHSLVDSNYEDRQVMLLKGPGDLLVAPHKVHYVTGILQAHGLQYDVIETDYQAHHDEVMTQNALNKQRVQRRYDADIGPRFDYSYYMELDELSSYSRSLVAASSIAEISSIGQSYNGESLDLITINGDTSLPSVWLDSGIHAREWITPVSNLYMLEQILTGSDADSVRMRNGYRWYILLSNNPDGYLYTWSNDRMWRKTRSPNSGSACVGTDPNRNFGYQWGTGGSSPNPCADDYRGSSAFSESETSAVRDAVTARRSGMIAFVSIHSYSQMWLHPWGYTSSRPSDYPAMLRNSNAIVAAIRDTNGRVFQVGSPPDLLYAASGGSFDWVYGDQGVVYGYSPELRPATAIEGGFDPDPSHILPSGRELYAGIIAMVDDIAENN